MQSTSKLYPSQARDIAESVLAGIRWQDATTGYCECPGKTSHTHATAERHCRVTLDGIPTVFCFHTSCASQIETLNHSLRSAIAKRQIAVGDMSRPKRRTKVEIEAARERERVNMLRLRAKTGAAEIYTKYAIEPAELVKLSPVPMPANAVEHFALHLKLFLPDDMIWIGDKFSSCGNDGTDTQKNFFRRFFRPAAEWLKIPTAPNQFTCPSVFIEGTYSRSNANVLFRRFLVVESDTLTKAQIGGVFLWCKQFMRLRAVVDTAGKSLHGWFDAPGADAEKELRATLPALGCDPALFKLSQPCRLAGAARDGKVQTLLYLDLEEQQ